MSEDIYQDIAQAYAAAAEKAPGLKSRFTAAGFDPAAVTSVADLSRLPVMKKEELLKIQRDNPPFGGFLASDLKDIGRIYVSPGPIFEPALSGGGGHGLDLLFKAAGVGPGVIILNTWMYHLVPAGLLFDEAAQSAGATVIPGGVGNTELQAQIIVETGVTSICASTAFFLTLADKVIETYGRDAWKVKTAFLGGEMGDWMAKRRRIEADYGVSTWAAYATADLGLVAYEDGGEGYGVHPDRVVQICDPDSGEQVAHGEPGEVVVTARDATWPMIRFGTGDSAFALESNADGTVSRGSARERSRHDPPLACAGRRCRRFCCGNSRGRDLQAACTNPRRRGEYCFGTARKCRTDHQPKRRLRSLPDHLRQPQKRSKHSTRAAATRP